MKGPAGRGARRRMPGRRVALALVVVALVTATAMPAAGPASFAQPRGPDVGPDGPGGIAAQDPSDVVDVASSSNGVSLTVTSLTGVLGPGSYATASYDGAPAPRDLELRAAVENVGDLPLDALQLVVEIHPPAAGRGALHEALEEGMTTQSLHVDTQPVRVGAALAPGEIAGVTATMEADAVDWADGPGGVHPIRVAVIRGTQVLVEASSAIVWLNEQPTNRLLTALVVPFSAPPWRAAGGNYPYRVDRDIQPGSRLRTVLAATELTSAPLLLAPAAHLLEDLGDRSDGYQSIRRRADGSAETLQVAADLRPARRSASVLRRLRDLAADATFPPVAATYADADLAALAQGGSGGRNLAATAATEGRERLQRQLGVEVDSSTHLITGPITHDVLDLVPGNAVLLPASTVDHGDLTMERDGGEPVRRLQAPAGRVLTGLLADPYLASSLSPGVMAGGPLLAAQRPIAESAMAYLSAPRTADRGFIVMPTTTWNPTPKFANEVLDGLGKATWLRFVPANRLVNEARRSTQTVALTEPHPARFPTGFLNDLLAAEENIAGMVAARADVQGELSGRGPDELQEDVLRATSRWHRGSGEGEAIVRDVQRTVDLTFGAIEVTTGSVTLTSDTGQVPVTLQRTRGDPIQVVVNVESSGGLLWPEDRRSAPLLLEEDTSQTVSFPARALSTGTFPVTVRVTDPSGVRELAVKTMSVHSRAISGPALGAIAAVIAVLLVVGTWRRRSRARPDPDPPALVAVPDAGRAGDGD